MKCEQAEELISALIDDELSDPERSSIEGHLKDCPTCQRAYEWGRVLNREMHTVSASVVASVDLRQRILTDQRTSTKESKSTLRSRLLLQFQSFVRPAYALALIAIVAVSIFFLVSAPNEPLS